MKYTRLLALGLAVLVGSAGISEAWDGHRGEFTYGHRRPIYTDPHYRGYNGYGGHGNSFPRYGYGHRRRFGDQRFPFNECRGDPRLGQCW